MADVVVTGGGMGGLVTAMLLAGDGHAVTVLERDPAPAARLARARRGRTGSAGASTSSA